MDLGLQNQIALVTGASRGLGRDIVTALAAQGCRLVLVARGQEALEETAHALRQTGASVLSFACDLTITADIERAVSLALTHHDHIDILIHNAGGAAGQDIFDTTDHAWNEALALNVTALSHLARLLVPGMREAGGGRILAISSIFGRESGGRMPHQDWLRG